MQNRQHVWVDGSLSDGEWYKQVFVGEYAAVLLVCTGLRYT
jgi:hypothetical protein